jgi:hypothetical protein
MWRVERPITCAKNDCLKNYTMLSAEQGGEDLKMSQFKNHIMSILVAQKREEVMLASYVSFIDRKGTKGPFTIYIIVFMRQQQFMWRHK